MSINPAEEIVTQLSRRSFLALWSYPNPRGKGGKELCDLLVVCDPDIIIFSVKDLKLKNSGRIQVDWDRWQRKAIDESATQIYGAERWLQDAQNVIRSDGTFGTALPEPDRRRVHRVAVALGSRGLVPVYMGDLGKGFVHTLTEESLGIVMGELDTVEDFVQYIRAKENLTKGTKVLIEGTERDLLAVYLTNGRTFPVNIDALLVTGDIWASFSQRPEYFAKKQADSDSYVWDRLVNCIGDDVLEGRMEFGCELNETELAIRSMARESRFCRRLLGKTFKEFLGLARDNRIRSRMVRSPSSVVYVFLAVPHEADRKFRVAELGNRCFIARGLNRDSITVVGIATEQHKPGMGFSIDVVYLNLPIWKTEHQVAMEGMQENLGFFANAKLSRISEEEYPPFMTDEGINSPVV